MTTNEAKPAIAAINALFAKSPDGLREIVRAVMQEMLEAEMTDALGAEKGERLRERRRISGPDRAGVRLVVVRGLAFADPWLGDRRAGLSAFDDVQDCASPAMAHALRPGRGGGGARPGVLSSLLRPAVRHGDAGSRLDLALPPDDRQAWPVDEALGRGQPAARCARPCHQARHVVDAILIAGAVRRR